MAAVAELSLQLEDHLVTKTTAALQLVILRIHIASG